MANQTNKRSRTDCYPIIEIETFPHFLIIENKDPEKPLKISPFAINKGIEGLIGTTKNIKKLRSGCILVEVDKAVQAKSLLKIDTFVQIPVQVTPHKTLNSCKGVVRCPELRDCENEEICEELADQHVSSVHRATIMQNGVRKPTNTIFLTFDLPNLPQYVKVGYLKVKIETYVPNPIRCFKCQRFGHFKTNCRRNESCEKCGKEDHSATDCQAPIQCINCNGNHSASSKSCPKWVEEKEIQKIKAVSNIPYPEARKSYQISNNRVQHSYASKTKVTKEIKPTREVNNQSTKVTKAVQTDLTWPSSSDEPIMMKVNTDSKATNTEKVNLQQKQGQQKKGQTKTAQDRRSRSLSRDPPSRNANEVIKQPKKPVKEKDKVQLNTARPKLTNTIATKNRYSSLSVEGVEDMETIPSHQPTSKLKVIPANSGVT